MLRGNAINILIFWYEGSKSVEFWKVFSSLKGKDTIDIGDGGVKLWA